MKCNCYVLIKVCVGPQDRQTGTPEGGVLQTPAHWREKGCNLRSDGIGLAILYKHKEENQSLTTSLPEDPKYNGGQHPYTKSG